MGTTNCRGMVCHLVIWRFSWLQTASNGEFGLLENALLAAHSSQSSILRIEASNNAATLAVVHHLSGFVSGFVSSIEGIDGKRLGLALIQGSSPQLFARIVETCEKSVSFG